MNKLNFTKAALQALPAAQNSPAPYHDTKQPGLVLRVTKKGTKSFYHYRKINGRPEWMLIGRFPATTVKNARAAVEHNNEQITKGINPNTVKREQRQAETFGELFDLYLAQHAKLHKAESSWKKDKSQYDKYLKREFSSSKAQDLTKTRLRGFIAEMGSTPVLANRILALVSKIYNFAIADMDLDLVNPAKGIKRFKEKARTRFLQPAEMQAFFEAVQADPEEWARDYMLLGLFTGARSQNIKAMRWEELDLQGTQWHIPDSKNDEPLSIPLVPAAVEILARRALSATSEFVFPSKTSKSGHLAEPKKAVIRIFERAKLDNVVFHDLRRSMGSWLAAAGTSDNIVGKSLGHKSIVATRIYSRLNVDPVRQAMDQAAAAMQKASKEQDNG